MTVQTLAIIVLLVSFFVMIFLRFPIAYAVGLSSVLCMLVQGQALTDVCRLMVKGISSFSLMAVPFFITMGLAPAARFFRPSRMMAWASRVAVVVPSPATSLVLVETSFTS